MDSSAHLSSKIAIVTGAGSGIGKSVAIALAGDGYSVVLAGRRKEPLEATAIEVRQSNSRALVVVADINDPAAVRMIFSRKQRTLSAVSTCCYSTTPVFRAALFRSRT